MTTIQLIPTADVVAKYNNQLRSGVIVNQKTLLNRGMSATFISKGEAHYSIQNILTYYLQ